jgi:hypothetical protein
MIENSVVRAFQHGFQAIGGESRPIYHNIMNEIVPRKPPAGRFLLNQDINRRRFGVCPPGFLRRSDRTSPEEGKQKADDKHHRLCRLFSKFHNKKPLRITEIVRVSEKFNCQGALLCG